MRSITVKLIGAFMLVTFLATFFNALVINRMNGFFFNRYLNITGKSIADQLATDLAVYYKENNGWQNVGELFGKRALMSDMMSGQMNSEQRGNGIQHHMGNGGIRMMDTRLILVDLNNHIIADNLKEDQETSELLSSQPQNSIAITVDEKTVARLLVYEASPISSSPAALFIDAANRGVWTTTIVIAILGGILGFFIIRRIIAPIRSMTTAVQQISRGNFSQRVQVKSKDEVGELAKAFNQMAETLEHNQQQRRNMTADIAHELRTPISIIEANLEAMLDGVLQPNPEEIASLRDESSLLARLVDDLRLLSLAEAGQLKLQKSQVDIKNLLERASDPFRQRAEDQQVSLSIETAPQLTTVEVDYDRIAMVVRNLLSNALRYTPAGGRVEVKAVLDENQPAMMRIEVSDTGSGITPQDLPYVFDRFYRADPSRSRSSGGTGIGLAIVKQLVDAHGGTVWVQSPIYAGNSEGYGTRFCFIIPVE
jgi:two-component system, OmpR family, sensor histidine kinase BaeS